MTKWAYLILGGVAGTVLRYLVSGWVTKAAGTDFPYGTLVVNGAGCFVIGALAVLSDEKLVLGPEMKVLLMAGFCGAFTTFSAFILETASLLKAGESLKAFGNVAVSVTAGFFLFQAGTFLAQKAHL